MTWNLPFCPRELLYFSLSLLRTAIAERSTYFYNCFPNEYFNPSASLSLQAARSILSSPPCLLTFPLRGSELERQNLSREVEQDLFARSFLTPPAVVILNLLCRRLSLAKKNNILTNPFLSHLLRGLSPVTSKEQSSLCAPQWFCGGWSRVICTQKLTLPLYRITLLYFKYLM